MVTSTLDSGRPKACRQNKKTQLVTISDGLILSKVRYALPLFTKARVEETDPIHSKLNQVQVKINNLVRMILHKKLSDKISRKEMHEKFPWSSLNHMSIMSVLCEAWRLNQTDILTNFINTEYSRETRCATRQILKPNKYIENFPFINDCIKLLNHPTIAPVRSMTDINSIKKYVLNCLDNFPI